MLVLRKLAAVMLGKLCGVGAKWGAIGSEAAKGLLVG